MGPRPAKHSRIRKEDKDKRGPSSKEKKLGKSKSKTKKWNQKRTNNTAAKLTAHGDSEGKEVKVRAMSKSETLQDNPNVHKKPEHTTSLRERMLMRLDAARFRLVNEELDSMGTSDSDPLKAFGSSLQQFKKYHESYSERVRNWPTDPLEVIVKFIKKRISKDKVVADFGCGEARLAASIPHKTYSFDLFALNDRVTACDMSSTPLKDQSVDLAVFCLSLMGTEVSKFIAEASRVLKIKGILKIAEVSSRFPENYQTSFVKRMKKFGFVSKDKQVLRDLKSKNTDKDREEVFLMFEFLKIRQMKPMKGKLPPLRLNPCLYKKR